jgi:hypothetical protein
VPVDDRPGTSALDELLEEENALLTSLADDLFLIRDVSAIGATCCNPARRACRLVRE